jgi:hypothetical protein
MMAQGATHAQGPLRSVDVTKRVRHGADRDPVAAFVEACNGWVRSDPPICASLVES